MTLIRQTHTGIHPISNHSILLILSFTVNYVVAFSFHMTHFKFFLIRLATVHAFIDGSQHVCLNNQHKFQLVYYSLQLCVTWVERRLLTIWMKPQVFLKKYTTFFHTFIKFGRHVLYPRYVKYPMNNKEGKSHMNEFNIAGLDTVVDSMDACHVIIEKCSHRLKKTSRQKIKIYLQII